MILCKVLNESAAEVPALLTSKIGMKHSGVQLEAMAAIAKASKIRSLEDFQAAVSDHGAGCGRRGKCCVVLSDKWEIYIAHGSLL
jgi:predicted RNA methylase